MATRTIITLHDDLDGSEAEESISFAIDGVEYEIDLSGPNAHEFRSMLQSYVSAARAVHSPMKARTQKNRNAKVRAWAKENGIKVADRGTISAQVLERYKAAVEILRTLKGCPERDVGRSGAALVILSVCA
ncbi:Lsr2 family protein [Arthrobacter sp. ISL-95]|uniref:histone-like nucleoid-structuring protein Lsr2 n=1 Tax=Arthrobacter sp. ISL-95 TaxID=2819116 RepID=UPI001BE7992B|nr:Lsr2 family protein [Arthrobacter sp. ISL-95]MBT2588411.1 Lsr2 family protein [Arthrobacter sp. ISL-95]